MQCRTAHIQPGLVALLAEGVDRNKKIFCAFALVMASPSSRRAWIEILFHFSEF